MKGVRIINTGSDAVALEFKSKSMTGYITFVEGEFVFSHTVTTP